MQNLQCYIACFGHACDLITNLRLIDIKYYLITHYSKAVYGDNDPFDRFENLLLVSFFIVCVVCARVNVYEI